MGTVNKNCSYPMEFCTVSYSNIIFGLLSTVLFPQLIQKGGRRGTDGPTGLWLGEAGEEGRQPQGESSSEPAGPEDMGGGQGLGVPCACPASG